MRRFVVAPLLIVMLLAWAASAVAGPAPSSRSPQANKTVSDEYCADPEELAFLKLINDYRAQNGVGPLLLSQTLGAAAEHHSVDMATNNYFGHTLSDGTSATQNMTNHGYAYSTVRNENIAAGYETASSVFAAWQASLGHNSNMLSADFAAIGIGRAANSTGRNATWYWTTDFGGYADAVAGACASSDPTATATPEPVAVAYVASMSGKSATKRGARTVTVTVKVVDSSGKAVGGATVTVVLAAPDGTTQALNATTNARGQASFSATVGGTGTYQATVWSVDAGAKPYDPNRNVVSNVAIPVG